MGYWIFVVHLAPTVAVLAAVFLVVRGVSVRVSWRRRGVRHLDDTLA